MQVINIKTIVEQALAESATIDAKVPVAFPSYEEVRNDDKTIREWLVAKEKQRRDPYNYAPVKAFKEAVKPTKEGRTKVVKPNRELKRQALLSVLRKNLMHCELGGALEYAGKTSQGFPAETDLNLFKKIIENTPLPRLNQLIFDQDLLFSATPNIHQRPTTGTGSLDRYGLYTMNTTEFFLRANFINVVSCHALSMNNRPAGNLGYQCSPYWFCIGSYQKPVGNRFHHPLNVPGDLYDTVEATINKIPPFIVALNVCVGFVQVNERQTSPALYISRIYGDRRHASFWKIIEALTENYPTFTILLREENIGDGMPIPPRIFKEVSNQVFRFNTPPMYPLMTVMHNGKEYVPARHPDIVNTLTFENGMIAEELFGRVIVMGDLFNSIDFSAFNNDPRQKTKRVTFGRNINDVCDFCDEACDDNQLNEHSRLVFRDGKLQDLQGMCLNCQNNWFYEDNTSMWVPMESSRKMVVMQDFGWGVSPEFISLHSEYINKDGSILWDKAGFVNYFAGQVQNNAVRVIQNLYYQRNPDLNKKKLKLKAERAKARPLLPDPDGPLLGNGNRVVNLGRAGEGYAIRDYAYEPFGDEPIVDRREVVFQAVEEELLGAFNAPVEDSWYDEDVDEDGDN